jgi:alpha-D-ribose 1-methylphosphonate 5-phosphate C-P lyase
MTKHKNNTKKTVKQKSSKDTTEIVNTKCFFKRKNNKSTYKKTHPTKIRQINGKKTRNRKPRTN